MLYTLTVSVEIEDAEHYCDSLADALEDLVYAVESAVNSLGYADFVSGEIDADEE